MAFISVSILIEILHHSFANAIVGRNWVKGAGNLLFLTTSCESIVISMKKKSFHGKIKQMGHFLSSQRLNVPCKNELNEILLLLVFLSKC